MDIKKTRKVLCLDNQIEYVFTDCTPYEALEKMIYTLSLGDQNAEQCVINKMESGKTLYFDHNGKTYAVVNN